MHVYAYAYAYIYVHMWDHVVKEHDQCGGASCPDCPRLPQAAPALDWSRLLSLYWSLLLLKGRSRRRRPEHTGMAGPHT